MCKKSKKMVGGVLLCIGFLIVAGAVGGIDGDTIDLLPGALQIMIGFILSGVGIEYGELFNPPVMEIENLQEDTNETKIFEVGKKAYTFNQARYEEDMGRCVITAVSERYITDDIGNKFTVSSDDRDYLTAEGNRTLRLYVSEKEALEDLEHIRITNWINQHMKKLPSGSLKQLQLIIKCLENQDVTVDDGIHIDNEVLINALGVYRAMNQIEQEPLSAVTEMALKELLEYRTQQNSGDQL